MPKKAAILIIGNEVLTGKVQEANIGFLAQELFALGIELRRAVICPDEIDVIAADVNSLRQRYNMLFTTGGVGPTHDDVTLKGVAVAFNRELTRSREMEKFILDFYGDRCTPEHLRMADIPEGAELLNNEEVRWPVLKLENVFILPGVPEVMRQKFGVLRELFQGGDPFISQSVYTVVEEGELAALLDTLAKAHPDVNIGSYPQYRNPEYKVRLTVDGRSAEAVARAITALQEHLPGIAQVDTP